MGMKIVRNGECPEAPKKLKHSQLVLGVVYKYDQSPELRYFKFQGVVYNLNAAGAIQVSGNTDSAGTPYTETDESICIHIGKNVNG